MRTYARGLADFLSWLNSDGRCIALDDVARRTVEEYITDFRLGVKGGACRVDPLRAGQINLRTRKASPSVERQPATINHRLSVLASFYAYRIERDRESGDACWADRPNPVPSNSSCAEGTHGMTGRDAPRRGRVGELRQRVSRRLPRGVDPDLAQQLIDAATSWRDKAILTLLYRTGQRIGDWSDLAGRHGILGMALSDIDERSRSIVVRLKGARDEHRVPVTDDFWPLFRRYLAHERSADPSVQAAWIGLRKGRGNPLCYATFESSLRYTCGKLGVNVNAHMYRHGLAQAIVDMGRLTVAQEILGHAHASTTADVYARVDQQAMVEAVGAAKSLFDAQRRADGHAESLGDGPLQTTTCYVFAYDRATLLELDQAAAQDPGVAG